MVEIEGCSSSTCIECLNIIRVVLYKVLYLIANAGPHHTYLP